ncbi:MAG: UDP-N-acetylmuramate dehydrogenase [Candidatus Margulisbacteria bacterium]|nr:UDP-N-acetylmuramate dehydrogenase [Candidatus Margulisiibacteriota bacterium]
MQTLKQESLKNYTSFKIGGPADIYLPETIPEFIDLLKEYPQAFILGGGTKMLFPDEGLVLPVILTSKLNKIEETPQGIQVECGYRISHIFDFAAGIPVTAGGALYYNFGAFGHELCSFVDKVRIISSKEDKWLFRKDLFFNYRESSLKENHQIIAEVIFNKKQLSHTKSFLHLRQEKQPLKFPSAGSVFKNPQGNYAGKLIEACGLKGLKDGDAEIWEKHANFIINKGQASCQNVKSLVKKIQESVKEKFGIMLELELEIYGAKDHDLKI